MLSKNEWEYGSGSHKTEVVQHNTAEKRILARLTVETGRSLSIDIPGQLLMFIRS